MVQVMETAKVRKNFSNKNVGRNQVITKQHKFLSFPFNTVRPDKTYSTSSTDTAAIHKNKTDCDKTVPDKQSWTKQEWKEYIRETPVG